MRRTGANESEQFNQAIGSVSREIAREMGLDELPMHDPGFNFYNWAVRHVAFKYKKRGLDAFEIAGEAIQEMLFNPRSEDHLGSIYSYKQFASGREDAKFDLFFMRKFEQHANNEIRKRNKYGKNRTKKHVSILPGRFEEQVPGTSGVAEESLNSGFPAPSARMEEEERRQILDQDITKKLTKNRNGKALLEYWRMYKEGARAWEITDRLNALSESDDAYRPDGDETRLWSNSTVARLKDTIKEIMANYFQEKELSEEDVIGSTGERAIFQSRRN